ncbi:MAG TPA: PDZ domain-containing protein [Pyrinomonadaceae bacterium]|nr:PDZ domain-containing protein [Pyrinomonadaceae bacterium]
MKTETPQPETYASRAETETVTCPNCDAELARGMRFCRRCGYRLGEGLDEYVETVRLNNLGAFGAMPGGPLSRPADATTELSAVSATAHAERRGARHRRRARGLRWLALPVALFVAMTGGILFVSDMTRDGSRTRVSAPPAPRSFFGGGDFERVEGVGLMIESALPGAPAEAAGLHDGDVLIKFDGRPIESESDLRDVLRGTPVGKTVEVEYLRDGEPGRAMLTTTAANGYNARAFVPAAGSGYWGVTSLRRVPVEGTKLYGVRLGGVSANRPADIAGLKQGDIVIGFDGRPVRTRGGLESYIDHAAPGTVVNVTVIRGGQRLDIPVKMGKD